MPLVINYKKRFQPFLDKGLIDKVPSRWQLFQGWLEMVPYVLYPVVDDDGRHGGRLGHPIVRQFFLIAYTKGGQLLAGTGLYASKRAQMTHLLGTHHAGQPAYDMQLLMLLDGLDDLRQRIVELREPKTLARKLEYRLLAAIQGEETARAYRERILSEIDNVENGRLQTDWQHPMRVEFNLFNEFVNYCVRTYPAKITSGGLLKTLRRLAALPLERIRRERKFRRQQSAS